MEERECNCQYLQVLKTSSHFLQHSCANSSSNLNESPSKEATMVSLPIPETQKISLEELHRSHLLSHQLCSKVVKDHGQAAPSPKEENYIIFQRVGTTREPLNPSTYYQSLKGPELEILKDPNRSVLPVEKLWPFLLRFPINCFGINLGLGSQAILWKILAAQGHIWFMQVPILINIVMWSMAICTLILTASTYTLKVIFYAEAVRREFNHPIRINFFFAPCVACMLLILGIPPFFATAIPANIWILFVAPIFALNLKVYGDWIAGGEKRLCKVANPSTHLCLLGNFVGAIFIDKIGGNTELAIFFWSVGFLHYMVLLVTLYQRLPSATVLPKELHPIYFLFVALPNSASVSWASIMGKFDLTAKIIYFFAVFLFLSLVARAKLFYGCRFNIAWWAYTFPFTMFAIATVQYSLEVKHPFTQIFAGLMSIVSTTIVMSLAITTTLHTFVWKSIFPNDMAIALQSKGSKAKRRLKELKEDLLPV